MSWIKNIIAVIIGVVFPFTMVLLMRSHKPSGFAARELILYPLLFGSIAIVIILLLKKYYLKESFKDFNAGVGKWSSDILWGIGLTAIYFVLFYVERPLLGDILEFRSNEEMIGLMLELRSNPFLLLLWFGPVLWLGIALFEELVRVFMLSALWNLSQKLFWQIAVIFLVALTMGFLHYTQGPYGIVTITIKSLVAGFFYYRYKRLLPLIIAHVLYDGIQVAMFLLTYPG